MNAVDPGPGAALRIEIFPADLDVTADFYTRVLSFDLVRDERESDAAYLALERGAVRIGAARRPDDANQGWRRPPTGVELVIEVDDVQTERDRVAALWPLEEDLTSRSWGLRDFRLLDPSGHYLRVTERPHDATSPRRAEEAGA